MTYRARTTIHEFEGGKPSVRLGAASAEVEYEGELPQAVANTGYAALTSAGFANNASMDGEHALAELRRVDEVLKEAGINFPLGARGVRHLAGFAASNEGLLREAAEEMGPLNDRLRALSQAVKKLGPVFEADDEVDGVIHAAVAVTELWDQGVPAKLPHQEAPIRELARGLREHLNRRTEPLEDGRLLLDLTAWRRVEALIDAVLADPGGESVVDYDKVKPNVAPAGPVTHLVDASERGGEQ